MTEIQIKNHQADGFDHYDSEKSNESERLTGSQRDQHEMTLSVVSTKTRQGNSLSRPLRKKRRLLAGW